ncbi:flagellar assembly protein FliH [Psychromonas antarctica]|uniref:flagellar assembly protein FliH n=1 Tax=Psychromonas antarctica TaxID=67573 RepID=UPI001EE8328F|nr:flagellar assembly protein FliH [Psychromonas antarctica]MCG6199843.1 flagellar assembly protein FliH [Psychromonas antarctica]
MSDKETEFKHWPLPELEESAENETEETTLFGKPATWYHSEHEDIAETASEEELTPLTLDDIEAIRQSAYEDGFKEGHEAGLIQGIDEGKIEGSKVGLQQGIEEGTEQGLLAGQVQIDEQSAVWQSLIERLHNPLEKLDDNVEYQLIRLATALAEQITRSEVQTDPQIILQALKQAVEALPVAEQTLRILLHPEDLKFVQSAYPEAVCLKRGWDLQSEPVLSRGDCQIHTQTSSVDYAFSTRIEQVLKHFFKENHSQLPEKNDDSNLLNEHPLQSKLVAAETAQPSSRSVDPEIAPNQDAINE